MQRSIVIIVNAKLKLCETKGLAHIFEDDDLNMREFATGVGGTVDRPTKKKMALFLCTNDNDTNFNFVCSMLYTQAIEILCRMADNDFRDKGYVHPVEIAIDPQSVAYLTVDPRCETHAMEPVSVSDIPEDAKVVEYTEDEFLHANFEKQDRQSDVQKYYQFYMGMRAG